MEIIAGGRQSGKTTKLIEKAAEEGGYIVCRSQEECSRIFNHAKKLGLDIKFPLTYTEFVRKDYYGPGVKELYIDNVKDLLQYISNVPVEAMTINTEF